MLRSAARVCLVLLALIVLEAMMPALANAAEVRPRLNLTGRHEDTKENHSSSCLRVFVAAFAVESLESANSCR